MIVFGETGEASVAAAVLGRAPFSPLVARLFGNDVTPGRSSRSADFVELAGAGYEPIEITEDEWSVVPGDPCVASCPPLEFVVQGAVGDAVGWFLTRSDGGFVLAERFEEGPFPLERDGDRVRVSLELEFSDRSGS